MKPGLEERNAESLTLARQYERVGKGVEVRDQAVRRAYAERVEEMHSRRALRERGELGEVALVRGVVRAWRTSDDEGRRMTTSTEDSSGGDRRLDPLPTCEPRREQKERIRAVEIEPLGKARARGREAEGGRDVHAVRNDVDLIARETRDRRELVGALVGDSDVADARVGARDELPRIARMTFGGRSLASQTSASVSARSLCMVSTLCATTRSAFTKIGRSRRTSFSTRASCASVRSPRASERKSRRTAGWRESASGTRRRRTPCGARPRPATIVTRAPASFRARACAPMTCSTPPRMEGAV